MKKKLFFVLAVFISLTISAQQQNSRHSTRTANPQPQYQRNEPMPPMPPVATPEQVDMIVRYLQSESFDEKRYNVALLCIHLTSIPVDGLRMIAKEFSYDDNRLKFLKAAYQFCPDREKYWFLEDCFTFKTNGEELMKFVRSKY